MSAAYAVLNVERSANDDEVIDKPNTEHALFGNKYDAILYRGLTKDGEYSSEYNVEFRFRSRDNATAFLRRHKQNFREIEDHKDFPYR